MTQPQSDHEPKERAGELMRLREQLNSARRILGLYDSPFPDAIEKYNRATQLRYVETLERALKRKETQTL